MRRLERERDNSWMDDACCRGIDPDLFYPERGESTAEAKAVCQGCPVRGQCLEYALTSPVEKHGVWGGLSEYERRRLRRQRRRAARLAVIEESAA